MSRVLPIAVVLVLALALPVIAQPDSRNRPLRASDQAGIRAAIESQLQAFRRDDGDAAFAHAAPLIQHQFRSAENFMSMVRQSYRPVYRPRTVRFGDLVTTDGRIVQRLFVVGPDGFRVIALYMMQRQPDGAWKISGVVLLREAGEKT